MPRVAPKMMAAPQNHTVSGGSLAATFVTILASMVALTVARLKPGGIVVAPEIEILLMLVGLGGVMLLGLDLFRRRATEPSTPPGDTPRRPPVVVVHRRPDRSAAPLPSPAAPPPRPARADAPTPPPPIRAPDPALPQRSGDELLAVTLENVEVGVVACDASGAVTIFNRSARELYGVPESAALGDSLDQYYEVYGRDGTTLLAPEEAPLARALRGETVRNDELMIASRSGWARTVTANARPISDATGRPLGALMTVEDITERSRTEQDLRKELEKARETDRLKSSFLANMSHEIRTPLNIILGYNSMVADYLAESGDSSQGPLLDAVSRASKRLMNTVHGILDISKIEVGAFEIHPVALKPGEMIEKEIREFEHAAADRGLTLTGEIEEADATVLFDEHCLTQALEHLLDNAIKFTEQGGISARLYRDSEGVLCLDIRDTGVGIDAKYLPYLFEPFSQEESGYTRRFEGSGIGLALVKNYLGFNDAEVTVESEKGKGSVFRIRFFKEVGKPAPQPWRVDEMSEPAEAKDSRKPLVLVVEDDWETQGYMKAILCRRFDVAVAASGDEFRRCLSDHGEAIRVILMDLSLKGEEDGLMLTRALREHPKWKHVAVIATTAHAFLEDQNRALAAGCDAFLAKPFGREELFATIDRLLAS